MVNLLVTGGCGFIGSHFVNSLGRTKKYKIVNIDAMYYCASEQNVDADIENYVFVNGNLRDRELIRNILITHEIQMVVHFAAQSHVQNSFDNALEFTQDNIVGTHNLLEECRHHNLLEKFIHVSTDEVYGESLLEDNSHKTEMSTLCPSNPYAATKAAAELIAQSYYHSFKMPIIITRGNNVYGPNQYPEKLIPKFIKLLKEGKKVTIQGVGNQLRAFLHVNDTVRAFEIILERGEVGQIYNIGCDSDMEYSVMDVAKLLIEHILKTDNYDEWIEYIEDRPFNDERYYISNTKLKSLGWTIKQEFTSSLKELCDMN